MKKLWILLILIAVVVISAATITQIRNGKYTVINGMLVGQDTLASNILYFWIAEQEGYYNLLWSVTYNDTCKVKLYWKETLDTLYGWVMPVLIDSFVAAETTRVFVADAYIHGANWGLFYYTAEGQTTDSVDVVLEIQALPK